LDQNRNTIDAGLFSKLWVYQKLLALKPSHKRLIFLGLDMLWVISAFFIALKLVGRAPAGFGLGGSLIYLSVLVPVGVSLTVLMGLDRIKLNAYEMRAAKLSAIVASVTALCGVGVSMAWSGGLPEEVLAVFFMVLMLLLATSRVVMREVVLAIYRNGGNRKRVLIYGAGQTGRQLAAALSTDDAILPIGFVDANPTLQSLVFNGLRVYAPARIRDLYHADAFDRVVLAMPSVSAPVQAKLARELRDIGCEVYAVPAFADMMEDTELRRRTVPVNSAALLGRASLSLDLPAVTETYCGKSILVTGAGGSIGSELCRQLLSSAPQCVVILDHSELALYTIERELRELMTQMPDGPRLVPVLGSVTDAVLILSVMRAHDIDIVLHAAAYKHVPMVEHNPVEGLRNNVMGTRVVAEAARDTGAEQFILVSTDKAVRPTSIMGSSKRLAEMLVQDLASRAETTRFSIVRFGNVLGSSGSVIPLFEEQIARGGPVTVTHEDVTRYFMTIAEAVRLVLLTGAFARGGDVFVLDMGEQVSILKIARQMIEATGYRVRDADTPDGDIELVITGLRPGEKMREELLIGSDMLTTPHPKILRAQEQCPSQLGIATALARLRRAIEARDEAMARAVITTWVEQEGREGDKDLMVVMQNEQDAS